MIHEVKVGRSCGKTLEFNRNLVAQQSKELKLSDSALVSKSELYNWQVAINKELTFQLDGQKKLTKLEKGEKNKWKIGAIGIGVLWILTLIFDPTP